MSGGGSADMGRAPFCTGISGSEITSAMDDFGLGQKARRSVRRNVQFMGREAADYINSPARAKAKNQP